jgi:hypothetical protein
MVNVIIIQASFPNCLVGELPGVNFKTLKVLKNKIINAIAADWGISGGKERGVVQEPLKPATKYVQIEKVSKTRLVALYVDNKRRAKTIAAVARIIAQSRLSKYLSENE